MVEITRRSELEAYKKTLQQIRDVSIKTMNTDKEMAKIYLMAFSMLSYWEKQ